MAVPEVHSMLHDTAVWIGHLSTTLVGSLLTWLAPVSAGLQAIKDKLQDKVRTRPFPATGVASVDYQRERLRSTVLTLWWAQVTLAVVDACLIGTLLQIGGFPKEGTVFDPNGPQSLLLILALVATFSSIAISVVQLKKTTQLDKLKPS